MWWVMMREPAADRRLYTVSPRKRPAKEGANQFTHNPHSQTKDTNTQIAQDRKEDSNTLITCRTRSQRVKDKRGSHKCSHSSREFYLESSLVKSSSGCPGEYPEGHVDVIMII